MERYNYESLSAKYLSGSKDTFADINPANGEILANTRIMAVNEVNEIIELAHSSFETLSSMSPPTRGRLLYKAGEIMEQEKEALARLMTEEEGKTYNDSLLEVVRSYELLKFYGSIAFKYGGSVIPSADANTRIFTVRKPLGVVGLITPWNFPLSIPIWKAAPALAMGNAIVIKPASKTPLLVAAFVDIMIRAGFPKNSIVLAIGSGNIVGKAIVKSNEISAVSFTGSLGVGKEISRMVGEKSRFTRIQLELGGKNAQYIDENADLELAINLALRGSFGLTGQSCTATSRLIVHRNVYDKVKNGLLDGVKKWKVGNGLDKGIDMGPVVDESQLKTDLDYIEVGKSQGAKLLYGGKQRKHEKSNLFLEPTIFDSVTPEMKIFREEIFGPVLSITVAHNIEEAINLINSVEYGHTSAIISKDNTSINKFIEEVETGVIKVNKPTVGLELQAPFGTLKSSGSNTWKEMGESALEFYSTEKTVYQGW